MKDQTVTIPANIQRLQAACADKPGRHNLIAVHFNEKVAVSSDGNILAVRKKPVDGNLPENENIRFDKAKSKRMGNDNFYRTGEKLVSDSNDVAEVIDAAFPPSWERVVPSLEPEMDGDTKKEPVTISLDPFLLLKLVDAMAVDKKDKGPGRRISLTFVPGAKTPGVVVTTSQYDCFGVIMPMDLMGQETPASTIIKSVLDRE